MSRYALWSLACLVAAALSAACTPSPGQDAGPSGDDGGAGVDAGPQPDAGGDVDAGALDAGDHRVDAGADDDGGAPGDAGVTHYDAILDERCAPHERAGLVTLTSWGGGSLSVNVWLADGPPPWQGPAELSDASCSYFDGASACSCAATEACAFGGGCAAYPQGASDVRLVLRAGDEEQVLSTPSTPGVLGEQISLPGETFSAELSGLGIVVNAPALTLPAELADLAGVLHGSYDAPTGLDLTWTARDDDTDVFTNVPINHHVATPTFTECLVDVSAGALHIEGAMLAPLAVSTGLEFQTLEPARFAAVDTELGCIEVRISRKQFPDLGI